MIKETKILQKQEDFPFEKVGLMASFLGFVLALSQSSIVGAVIFIICMVQLGARV